MLPNKTRGEFTRNQRKDSEVRIQMFMVDFQRVFFLAKETRPFLLLV